MNGHSGAGDEDADDVVTLDDDEDSPPAKVSSSVPTEVGAIPPILLRLFDSANLEGG